jgi:hypothetical protein
MTNGNEPQLGGQQMDDSPMISGRGTQVIVSARGAYMAGNLNKLIEMLDEAQQFEMRRIIARHAATYVAGVIGYLKERYFEVVIRWADDPTEANLEAIRSLRPVRSGGDQLTNSAVEHVLDTALQSPAQGCVRVMKAIACAHEADDPSFYNTIRIGLKRWYLDVVWALLTKTSVPTSAPQTYYAFDALEKDPEAMYWGKNVAALTELMNPAQQDRFKQAVLRQGRWYLDHHMPVDALSEQEHEWLRAIHRWIDHPETFDRHQWEALYTNTRDQHGSFMFRNPLVHMLSAFQATQPWTDILSVANTAHSIVLTVHAIQGAQAVQASRENPWLDPATAEPVIDWQAEAAWAIMHDREVPPLE